MNARIWVIPCLWTLTGLAAHAADYESTVAELPAFVVKTVPAAGDTNVDPNITEVRVTFSKNMRDGSWSWSQFSEDTKLPSSGKPHYLPDGKTCVLPVKFEPGKTYGSWLNSEKFHNFKDADGKPAWPYLLVFQTKGAGEQK
jgi:RNA polymerase sigma-70 factor (ECF subfamily)